MQSGSKQAAQSWHTTNTSGMNRQVATPEQVIKTGAEQMLSYATVLIKSITLPASRFEGNKKKVMGFFNEFCSF